MTNELLIIKAISNPKFDFRTINGIAKETNLNTQIIESTINKYPNIIRKCKIPNKNNESLFTLSNKPVSIRENIAFWLFLIKKSL